MDKITVCSHTLIRNGMPFIELVLRQVEPFMNRMLITISEKSMDGTLNVVRKFEKEFKDKVRVSFENVSQPGQLTAERQKQVEQTHEDWILFLDDDDYWPTKSLNEIKELLNNDVDGFAVSPYQVIDSLNYDAYWLNNKFFSKWFRNININYRHPWPKDLIYSGEKSLYWKHNSDMQKLVGKYFHLSNVKNGSFRKEEWASKFNEGIKYSVEFPDEVKSEVWKIFNWKSTH